MASRRLTTTAVIGEDMTHKSDIFRRIYEQDQQDKDPFAEDAGFEDIYCTTCGQKIPAIACFCPSCGSRVQALPEMPDPTLDGYPATPARLEPLADLEEDPNLLVEEVFVPFSSQHPTGLEQEPVPDPIIAAAPVPQSAHTEGFLNKITSLPRRQLVIGLIVLVGVIILIGSVVIGLALHFSPGFAAKVTAIFTPTPPMAVAFAFGQGRAATVTTDVSGKAHLADPVTQQPVEVTVRASENGASLPGIQVNYLSDGTQVLVIATDPSGQRAPAVVQPAPQTDASQPRVIVIDMRLLSSFGSAQEIMDYNLNQYPLQSWNWSTEDYCLTSQQLAFQLDSEKANGMFFIPLIVNTDEIKAIVANAQQAQGIMDLFQTVVQHSTNSQNRLSGVLRLRYYRLAPLPLTLVEWQGLCVITTPTPVKLIHTDYKYHDENSGPKYMVDLTYPLFQGQDTFNKFEEDRVKELADKFIGYVKLTESQLGSNFPRDINSTLQGKYTLHYARNNLVSVDLQPLGYEAGQGQPSQMQLVINYDLSSSREIKLDDVLGAGGLEIVSKYCLADLNKRVLLMNTEGAAPRSENYKYWNFEAEGLVIIFGNSQVGPEVAGDIMVTVPYTKLNGHIKKDSPLEVIINP